MSEALWTQQAMQLEPESDSGKFSFGLSAHYGPFMKNLCAIFGNKIILIIFGAQLAKLAVWRVCYKYEYCICLTFRTFRECSPHDKFDK